MLKSKIITSWWRPVALCVTAILGLALRLYGLDWDGMLPRSQWMSHLYGVGADQGANFHPDERQIMYQVIKLSWPTSWAQFMDQAHSPLNPHFFAYGTFPLYLLAFVGNILSHISPILADFAHITLTGRTLNVLFDTGTILLTAWLALLLTPDPTPDRRRAWSVALLAAACVAFTPFEVQQTHFYTVDVMALFFAILTLVGCVKLIRTERPVSWALIVGLGYGLGLATKTSTAPLILPLLLALGLRWYHKRDFWEVLIPLIYACCITALVFIVAMPYALLDFSEFRDQVSYQGDLARGLIDLPYVRQFAGTTPVLYQLQNLVFWGMGLLLGVASLAGLLWLCWRLWRHEMASWLVPLSWVLVYGAINCAFFTKYMRYLLPVYPLLVLMGACMLIWLTRLPTTDWNQMRARVVKIGSYALIGLVLAGTLFQCLALDMIYSQPNTRIQASEWIFENLPPGTVMTYEQWDDALPVVVNNHDPSIYPQASYVDAAGNTQQGLDLYGDDTVAKAHMLATMLMQVGAITMPTDRLDKSIPRLPARYPLTIRYYALLFHGQLGFHLAKEFVARPSFLGITLNDSDADESYSVFDHPDARIFVRDSSFPFQTVTQLETFLLQGVQLPPSNPQQTGAQKPLVLSQDQLANDQNSPPLAQQFPTDSFANHQPVFFWWLTLTLLGLLVYPLTFLILRGLKDRGYLFAKTLSLLLLAYLCWLLANWRLAAFSHLSTLLTLGLLASMALVLVVWLRRTLWAFLRERWRLLLLEELLFTLAFLLFVLIRSFNPDLWQPFFGGEKPMELAFLNGILRSPYMPPLDPWFSGGIINYYYYGYIVIAAVVKLTGIAPTTAFNLAIPTLFALTFTGAFSLVYSLSQRLSVALLAGYLVTLLGNFDGVIQVIQQYALWWQHLPVPLFNYWQSSRVIPFTINEFPLWSFLFADLHPHVIAMPLSLLLLGMLASCLLARQVKVAPAHTQPASFLYLDRQLMRYFSSQNGEAQIARVLFYLLLAFVFGAIACINPWDMPVCVLVLASGLLLDTFYTWRGETRKRRWWSGVKTVCLIGLLCILSYFYYWPFYASYQQLYVNGLGFVSQSTGMSDYLRVFGIWLFLCASFLLFELYRWWQYVATSRPTSRLAFFWRWPAWGRVSLYLLLCISLLSVLAWQGTRFLLGALLLLGLLLFFLHGVRSTQARDEQGWNVRMRFIYMLVVLGLAIALGIEVIYIRDFLDISLYARMNTVFKFSMQIWLCLGIGGALAIEHLWRGLQGFVKRAWSALLLLLLLGGSVFLVSGTYARIQDHQKWIDSQAPVQSANYTPTLDGFAFVRAWYPGDAQAITWLNAHVAGSPIILEAATPYDFAWFGRVSVYTGLPTVLGWLGHENEQRYQNQAANRLADISIIYSTADPGLALELLHHYNVRYIYVGDLEREAYAPQSSAGLDKFDAMAQQGSAQLVYRWLGVAIYKVL